MIPSTLPFEYLIRGGQLARLDGQLLAAAFEQRDRDLENFIAGVLERGSVGFGLTGVWQINSNAGAAPGGAQLSTDTGNFAAPTWVRFARRDKNNIDFYAVLMSQAVGSRIVGQQMMDASNFAALRVTGAPSAVGDYVQVPVSTVTSGGTGSGAWQDAVVVLGMAGT